LFQQDPTFVERLKQLPAQTLGAGQALASLGSAAALSVPSMVQSLVTGEKDPLGMMKRQMYVPTTEEGMGALSAVAELIPEIPAMPQVQLQALQAIPAGAAAAQAQRGLQGGLRAAQPMLAEGAERILGAQGLMMKAAPEGGVYETIQEGPFYRVKSRSAQEAGSKDRGVREEVRAGEGAPGSGGGDVPQPISDEAVGQLVKDPTNFVRKSVEDYSQKTLGQKYELPEMPESSLAKQSAIGRTFQIAAEGGDDYKQAVFNAYGSKFPELVESTGAKNYDQLMEAAYRQLAKETADQFRALPVNMSYHRAGEGNYRSSNEMLRDIYGNRHLYVYQGGDIHDFLNAVDPATGLNTNEMFRAVHDFYGHAIHGNSFGPKGEEIAYGAHSRMFSPLARMAMASETRGQNSFVNYTPVNAPLKQRINKLNAARWEASRRGLTKDIADIDASLNEAWKEFQFAPQKSVLLPPEFLDLGYKGGMPEYVQSLSKPAAGTTASEMLTHFSHSPDIRFLDPLKYGSGIAGEEMNRLKYAMNPVMERLYAYTGDPSRVKPEPGLGPYRYGAKGESLYDVMADPMKFRVLAAEANRIPYTSQANKGLTDPFQAFTDVERMVKEYGYEGMMNPEQGTAILYRQTPVQRFKKGGLVQAFQAGGIVKGAVAGAKAGAKGAKQASDAAIRVSKKLEEISEKPVATPAELDKAIQQSSKRIAKDNPKLSEQEVEKKAERDVLSRFRWERIDKPSAVSDFGELVNEPYSAPLARRFRNVPSVVEERAQRAEEFLRQPTEPWTPPPPGLQAFDRSLIKEALEGFPGVEQTRFPRYQPARADVGYVGEMYDDPRNRELIKQQIMRGLPLGGETFYGSLYPLKMAALERGIPAEKFEQFVYETAPASARNSIMNEMAVGQFLRDMKARGLPLDEKTVAEEMAKFKQRYGTGLPLMPVHRQGVQQVIEGGTNLREQVKADIPTNYKIPTYGTQKAGDFGKSVVLDVHEAAGETLASPYHPYFTRQGGFGSTEYGLAESKMLDIANELGIPGGMAQAGRWFGGGELTGLKSPRGDALDLLEKQTAYTLQGQGVKPTPKNIRNYILDMVETGEGVLMPYFKSEAMPDVRTKKKKGGSVKLGGLVQSYQSGGKVISLAAKSAKAAKEAKVVKPIAKETALSTVDFADKNWRSAIDDVVKYMNNVGVPYAPWQFMRDKPDVPLGRIMDEIERDVYFVRSNPILPEGQVNLLEELFKKAKEAEASYTRSGTPRDPMTGEPTMASGGLAVLRNKHGN
jgi:hypothetical protein